VMQALFDAALRQRRERRVRKRTYAKGC
jgi:hypothetical protein